MVQVLAQPQTCKLMIGDVLVSNGKLSEKQRKGCIAEQERLRELKICKRFGEVAVDLGFVSAYDVEQALSELLGTNAVKKHAVSFYQHFKDRVIVEVGEGPYESAAIKKDFLGDEHIIKTMKLLGIMSYQDTFRVLREIVLDLKMESKIVVDYNEDSISVHDGQVYLRTHDQSTVKVVPVYYPQSTTDLQILLPYDEYDLFSKKAVIKKDTEKEDNTITFIEVVQKAVMAGASDIHIKPGAEHYWIFFRIDGLLIEQSDLVMTAEQGEDLTQRIKIEAADFTKGDFSPDETKVAQAAKIDYPKMGVSVRLQFVPDGYTLRHLEVTARIITEGKEISNNVTHNLRDLGFMEEDIHLIESVIHRRSGLIILSGITNSGKSTTIWAILPTLESTKLIATVEDPIERVINRRNIIQHQIFEPEDKSLTMGYEQYIKAFKRSDYDVVFIGEWRQSQGLTESIIEQANAGQLLYTTLHIRSSFELYSALHEMFGVEKSASSRLVLLSLNQHLLQKLCSKCKKETEVFFTENDIKYLTSLSDDDKYALLNYRAKGYERKEEGCRHCHYTGYQGRVVVYDYFLPSNELITQGIAHDTPSDIKKKVLKLGLGRNKLSVFLERLREGVVEKKWVEVI